MGPVIPRYGAGRLAPNFYALAARPSPLRRQGPKLHELT